MHLCAELIAASMVLEPLGEVGANFSLQLSSRTQFTKINNKKVIAENQCEKHKKSSLFIYQKSDSPFKQIYFRASNLVNIILIYHRWEKLTRTVTRHNENPNIVDMICTSEFE